MTGPDLKWQPESIHPFLVSVSIPSAKIRVLACDSPYILHHTRALLHSENHVLPAFTLYFWRTPSLSIKHLGMFQNPPSGMLD
jgi:hypothetical protein